MHPDIDITSEREDSDVRVLLRREPFDLATNVLGLVDDTKRGRAIGVNPETVRTARRGGGVGEAFMSRTVAMLRRHRDLLVKVGVEPDLDGLFEVVEVKR